MDRARGCRKAREGRRHREGRRRIRPQLSHSEAAGRPGRRAEPPGARARPPGHRGPREEIPQDVGGTGREAVLPVPYDPRESGRGRKALRGGHVARHRPGARKRRGPRRPEDGAASRADQAVLASVLLNNDLMNDVVEILRPDDFYQGAHRTLFSTMVDLYERGRAIDQLTRPEAPHTRA